MNLRKLSAVLGAMALAGPLTAGTSAATAQAAVPNVVEATSRYSEAWDSGDVGRIAALHTADSTFRLVIDGGVSVQGLAGIKDAFAKILADNPAYRSKVRTIKFGSDFATIEYDILMAPPQPFVLGSTRYVPNGTAYSLPAIDVIHFRNGLVSDKVTYLDSAVVAANSRSSERLVIAR